MGTVEWIEIVTLVIVIAAVLSIYRYLGIYTRLLVNQRRVISDQGDILEKNAGRLAFLTEYIDGESEVLTRLMTRVDTNASDLKELREGIAVIRESFERIGALLDTDTPVDISADASGDTHEN